MPSLRASMNTVAIGDVCIIVDMLAQAKMYSTDVEEVVIGNKHS